MKIRLVVFLGAIVSLTYIGCNRNAASNVSEYIIKKENGQIILAYKAFEDFLNTDKSWNNYKLLLLDTFPEVQEVHKRQVWEIIEDELLKLKSQIQDLIERI